MTPLTHDPRRADRYVVGVDYGTLSGRAVVVRVRDGAELGSAIFEYPHGVISERLPGDPAGGPGDGPRLAPDWALQHPLDWVGVLRTAVPEALRAAGVQPGDVVGIGTDFTASTPLPVRADGTPLCLLDELAGRPHAYPKLWKHHAAQPQADRINAVARDSGQPWLARYGGKLSSEWQFAKALQVLEEDPEIYARCERWIEAADWIVWQLTGVESRNVCTAGYKGVFQDDRYPSAEFLAKLDPGLAGLVTEKVEHPLSQLGGRAGGLTAQAAQWTGLNPGTSVSVGNVDAHVTAAAVRATGSGQLVAIMGTSTCLVINGEQLREVPGMCGVALGGIVPGRWGYEAGQSGVGDLFAWLVDNAVPASYVEAARAAGETVHQYLSRLAARQAVGEHGLLALDWLNGNRSILVDHHLSGVLVGLTLDTRAEDLYRALVEATAFGARRIVDAFDDSGVPVREFVAAGGLTANPFVMQVYADVLNRPISVGPEQGSALGSAIHAAVAAGEYPDIHTASAAMGSVRRDAYLPRAGEAAAYAELYLEYRALHDHFGQYGGDTGTGVLHRLRAIRNAARVDAARVEATAVGQAAGGEHG
ncbi:MAG: ribulokinase [Micromonosporaceae bacterium]|nr:ribulokinase [Micromonosporaceae bacterium]